MNRAASSETVRSVDVRKTLARHGDVLWAVMVGVVFLGLFLLIQTLPVRTLAEWLRERVEVFGIWAPIAYGLAFVLVTTFSLPGWPFTIGGGLLFGPWLGTLTMSTANVVSAALVFAIGRFLAGKRVARRLQKYPRVQVVYKAIGHGGWKVVAAVRLSHSLPFGLQNFLFGLSPIRFWPYLITTWAITLPGIFVQVYLGHAGGAVMKKGEQMPDSLRWLTWAGFFVAAMAVIYLIRLGTKAIRKHVVQEVSTG